MYLTSHPTVQLFVFCRCVDLFGTEASFYHSNMSCICARLSLALGYWLLLWLWVVREPWSPTVVLLGAICASLVEVSLLWAVGWSTTTVTGGLVVVSLTNPSMGNTNNSKQTSLALFSFNNSHFRVVNERNKNCYLIEASNYILVGNLET